MICQFVSDHHIDSFLKLRVLLSLHELPSRSATLEDLGDKLYVADLGQLRRVIADLTRRGIMISSADWFRLCDEPEIDYCLACLSETFQNPVTRQGLLDQIAQFQSRSVYHHDAHDSD